MKRITTILLGVYKYVVIVLPFFLMLFLSVVYILGGWGKVIEGHSPEYYFLPTINFSFIGVVSLVLWILLCIVFIKLIDRINIKNNESHNAIYKGLIIGLVAVSIRVIIVFLNSEYLVPFSDFAMAWERAHGNLEQGNIAYYSLFPAYMNFSLYENMVINILEDSYVVVLYLNALYSGITAYFLYYISKELFHNERVCVAIGVLYGLYPSNVLYTLTGTPDFIAIMFNTIGIYLLLKYKVDKKCIRRAVLCMLAGLCFGISGSFKTFSIVIMVAFFLCEILIIIINEMGYKEILFKIGIFILVIMSYKVVNATITDITSDYYNVELDAKTATPHYILVGLNTEAEGQIHIGNISRLYYQRYLDNGNDFESSKEYAYDTLKKDWKNNPNRIIPNFFKKIIWAWQDDYIPIHYYLYSVGLNKENNDVFLYKLAENSGGLISELIYVTIAILSIVGSIRKAKENEGDIEVEYIFLSLIIFGYFCMVILSESQSRYKCLIMPYIIIVAGYGIELLIKYQFRIRMIMKELKNEKSFGYRSGWLSWEKHGPKTT
ncbi:MAG: phospholipid carrier-dependent glycosyltransferase [Pseudobutyrivibrio ruminis]|uniref:glycosyltransferase family 39 protein n=1 Tax=Pseudobutyrivibrio ruminis TaxID=46206 RepID=UPI0026ED5CE0|nr:glycosyltransferase family 39 protein [Pseudobutyrivibrio ruminis]MBE5912909.1 phospholipid carrier-dependent glycosyltransferase [Pseudobutyrivibrio ruminis]